MRRCRCQATATSVWSDGDGDGDGKAKAGPSAQRVDASGAHRLHPLFEADSLSAENVTTVPGPVVPARPNLNGRWAHEPPEQ